MLAVVFISRLTSKLSHRREGWRAIAILAIEFHKNVQLAGAANRRLPVPMPFIGIAGSALFGGSKELLLIGRYLRQILDKIITELADDFISMLHVSANSFWDSLVSKIPTTDILILKLFSEFVKFLNKPLSRIHKLSFNHVPCRLTFCVSHSRGESAATHTNQMTTDETRNQSKTKSVAAVGSAQLVRWLSHVTVPANSWVVVERKVPTICT
jgi:hypothetical protein